MTRPSRSLRDIGFEVGTDKITDHRYEPYYERHLATFRDKAFTLLEIGIFRGQSLRMWREYFPKARILGVDNRPQTLNSLPEGCEGFIGDQTDPKFLGSVAKKAGGFDVVIDDGGHYMKQQTVSFKNLFPHVRANGFYIIEDLATSFQPKFGGGPPGTPGRTLDMLKDLVEQLDYFYSRVHGPRKPSKVKSIHFYDSIAFVERSAH